MKKICLVLKLPGNNFLVFINEIPHWIVTRMEKSFRKIMAVRLNYLRSINKYMYITIFFIIDEKLIKWIWLSLLCLIIAELNYINVTGEVAVCLLFPLDTYIATYHNGPYGTYNSFFRCTHRWNLFLLRFIRGHVQTWVWRSAYCWDTVIIRYFSSTLQKSGTWEALNKQTTMNL